MGPPLPGRLAGWRRVLGGIVVVVVAAFLVLAVRPARVAVQAAALLPALFPEVPLDPLTLVTPAPLQDERRFRYAAGEVVADVYRPGSAGPHGGAVLELGARFAQRDPVLVRFARALARLGVVVVVPGSDNLLAGRILPEERDALRRSYDLLLAQPGVDPERTGFLGFSVGGGLSILAASDPGLRDRVRFVSSLGGYADAELLLLDVASRSIVVGGEEQPWQPHPLTLEVLAVQIVETMPEETDRTLLRRAFVDGESVGAAEWERLSPAGRDARTLLGGAPRDLAGAAIQRLPPSVRERLAAISPSHTLVNLRARLYLMHDTGDTYIPFTQTRALAAQAPPGLVREEVETSIFEHVYPDKPVPWQTFLPEFWALFWYVHAVLLELL